MISIVKMLSPDFPWVKNNPLDIKKPMAMGFGWEIAHGTFFHGIL